MITLWRLEHRPRRVGARLRGQDLLLSGVARGRACRMHAVARRPRSQQQSNLILSAIPLGRPDQVVWSRNAVSDPWDGFDHVGGAKFAAQPTDGDLNRLREGVGVLVPCLLEEVFRAEGGW